MTGNVRLHNHIVSCRKMSWGKEKIERGRVRPEVKKRLVIFDKQRHGDFHAVLTSFCLGRPSNDKFPAAVIYHCRIDQRINPIVPQSGAVRSLVAGGRCIANVRWTTDLQRAAST